MVQHGITPYLPFWYLLRPFSNGYREKRRSNQAKPDINIFLIPILTLNASLLSPQWELWAHGTQFMKVSAHSGGQ